MLVPRKKIIVIGGGFAGINFIKTLNEDNFEVLLIDRINHHQFQPLYYQVATSQLEPSSISFPLRKVFQNRKNLQIRMTEVVSVNTDAKMIATNIGEFVYDHLIIATGCRTNFFGNKHIELFAHGMKTTFDAIQLRNTILQNFEDIVSVNEEEKKYLFNIVIVGAGPTGVELAGAFAEIKKNILPKDFPAIDFNQLNIYLLEGSAHTLNTMSDKAKTASEQYLKNMGVKVMTNTIVKDYDGKVLTLASGETIKSKQVIWAAGVSGNIIDGMNKARLVQNRRMVVDRFNLVEGYQDIYALGDIAYMETPKYPKGHPQLANVAINQAKNLAKNLERELKQKEKVQYEYKNLGSMATIGKHKAVVDLPFVSFKGFFAWLIWMSLHLMLILSVKNKLIIFINWMFTYFTKDTSLRLILKEPNSKNKVQ
jgi:NADH:ubiquinone reductase (H+-translocating)